MFAIRSAQDLAVDAGGEIQGDPAALVSDYSDVAHATQGTAVFAEKPAVLEAAMASAASVIVTGPFARGAATTKTLIICQQPRLSFARIVVAVRRAWTSDVPRIHPTAVVDNGATIGSRVSIGARAVIEDMVVVGDECDIGPGVIIHSGTTLGHRVVVHAGSVLGSSGFGFVVDDTTGRVEPFPQLGTLVIGDDVGIGANVTIDRGTFGETAIGRGTKIDNLVQVAHNVRIGENVIIAAQTGIAGSAVIEDGVVLGGQVGIADHVRVCSGIRVGGQAAVPSAKILRGAPGDEFWGTPARPVRQVLRQQAMLARMAKR